MAIDLGVLGDLVIDVGADISGLENDLAGAAGAAEKAGQKIAESVGSGFEEAFGQLDLFAGIEGSLETATGQMHLFDDVLKVTAEDAVAAGAGLEALGAGAGAGGGGVRKFTDDLNDFFGASGGFTSKIATMVEGVLTWKAVSALLAIPGEVFDTLDQYESAVQRIVGITGQVGSELEGLKGSFENVFANVPESAMDAANSVAMLSARLGDTGAQLTQLATMIGDFAAVSGESVKQLTVEVSTALSQWQVSTDHQAQALANLMQVAQAAAVPLTTLADQMARFGPALQDMGLNFDQAALLLGNLDQQGFNTAQVLQSLQREMTNLAKNGVGDITGAMQGWVEAIKDADSTASAMAIAAQSGARNVTELVNAVRSGAIDFDDFTGKLKLGTTAIQDQAAQTETLAQAWRKAFNDMDLGIGSFAQSINNFGKTLAANFQGMLDAPKLEWQKFIDYLVVAMDAGEIKILQALQATTFGTIFAKQIQSGIDALGSDMAGLTFDIDGVNEKLQSLKNTADAVAGSTASGATGGLGGVSTAFEKVGKASINVGEEIKEAAAQMGMIPGALDPITKQTEELDDEVIHLAMGFDEFRDNMAAGFNFGKLFDDLSNLKQKMIDAGDTTSTNFVMVSDALEMLGQRMTEFGYGLTKVDQDISNESDKMSEKVGSDIQQIANKAAQSKNSFDPLTNAFRDLGTTMDGLTTKANKDLNDFDVIVNSNIVSVSGLEEAWQKVQQAISKLATDPAGMERVTELATEYAEKLGSLGAPLQAQLTAWEQVYALELKSTVAMGGTADQALLIQEHLSNVQALQGAITDSTLGLANLYRDLGRTFSDTWKEFGTGVGDAIVGAESWHDAWSRAITDLEKKISELVVNYLLGQLKDAIIKDTDALGGFQKTFNSIFGVGNQGSDSGSGVTETVSTVDSNGNLVTKQIGGQESSGSSGTSSSGESGGFLSGLNAVTGVVTALASVVGDIQNLHMSNLLGEIEVNTRKAYNTLSNDDGVAANAKRTWMSVGDLVSAFNGWFHDAFATLMSTTEDMDAVLRSGVSIGSGGGSSASGDTQKEIDALAQKLSDLGDKIDSLTQATQNSTNSTNGMNEATALGGSLPSLASAAQDTVSTVTGLSDAASQASGALSGLANISVDLTGTSWTSGGPGSAEWDALPDFVKQQFLLSAQANKTASVGGSLPPEATSRTGTPSGSGSSADPLQMGSTADSDSFWNQYLKANGFGGQFLNGVYQAPLPSGASSSGADSGNAGSAANPLQMGSLAEADQFWNSYLQQNGLAGQFVNGKYQAPLPSGSSSTGYNPYASGFDSPRPGTAVTDFLPLNPYGPSNSLNPYASSAPQTVNNSPTYNFTFQVMMPAGTTAAQAKTLAQATVDQLTLHASVNKFG